MNYFTQQKIYNLLIGILLLTNIGLLIVLFFPPFAPSEADHLPKGKKFGALLQHELGINATKADEIELLTVENHEHLKPIQMEHNRLTDSLIQLVKAPNDSLAQQLSERIGKTQEALEYNTYRYFVEVRNKLETKDQLAFDNFLKKMGKGRFIGGPPKKRGEAPHH